MISPKPHLTAFFKSPDELCDGLSFVKASLQMGARTCLFVLLFFLTLACGRVFGQTNSAMMPPTGFGTYMNLPRHTNDAHIHISWSEDLTNSVVLVYESKLLQGPYCLVWTNASTNIDLVLTSPIQKFYIIRAFNTNSPAFQDWTPIP